MLYLSNLSTILKGLREFNRLVFNLINFKSVLTFERCDLHDSLEYANRPSVEEAAIIFLQDNIFLLGYYLLAGKYLLARMISSC